MTVDSELRKIWRKELAELAKQVDDLAQQVARLRLELEPLLPNQLETAAAKRVVPH